MSSIKWDGVEGEPFQKPFVLAPHLPVLGLIARARSQEGQGKVKGEAPILGPSPISAGQGKGVLLTSVGFLAHGSGSQLQRYFRLNGVVWREPPPQNSFFSAAYLPHLAL